MATILIDQEAVTASTGIGSIVNDGGGLTVDVRPFVYPLSGVGTVYAGATGLAVADGTTNYVFLDSGGVATVNTTGYPDDVTKLARVQTSGGIVSVIVADMVEKSPLLSTDLQVAALESKPAAPPSGFVSLYGRMRAGRSFLDVQGTSGRDWAIQPHMGLDRVMMCVPSSGTAVSVVGVPTPTNVGTVSTPTLASTNFSTSIRRTRLTSAATANAAAERRINQTLVWIGNAAGLGGFTFITRISMATLAANCRGFFGLTSSTGAIATTQSPSALTNCIGFGWDSGETTFRFLNNDGSGACTKTDMGAGFPTNSTTNVYTMYLFSAPNGSSIGYRITNENTGTSVDGTVSSNIPANTTFLTFHQYMNNGGTAAAVAFDSSGVYISSDY
jgi:hypothetical protein